MTFFVVSLIVFMLSTMMLWVAMGLWTYADAKVKSDDNPVLWTILVVLAGFIGLIIYLAAGRKKAEKSPGKFMKFLIASIVCFGLSIPLYVIGLVRFVMKTI